MPTYEYRCKDCGDELEAVQGFHDDPLTECPSCGGPLRKKFGSVGISFKGSGFYKNDSRSTAGATSSSAKESSDGGSASGDTATATASSSKDGGSSNDGGSSDSKSSTATSSDKSSPAPATT
jgi:putative FmdB family regulatory protein